MDRYEVFASLRNMKDIFKMDLAMWGLQRAMTNMTNIHTCTICSMHLLIAVVPVADC